MIATSSALPQLVAACLAVGALSSACVLTAMYQLEKTRKEKRLLRSKMIHPQNESDAFARASANVDQEVELTLREFLRQAIDH
jgi:hypothetical protein